MGLLKMKSFKNESRGYVLFLAPALLLFSILFIYPALNTFLYAFTNWNGFTPGFKFIGFENFKHLLEDEAFTTSVKNTILFTIILTTVQNILAIILALVLDRPVRSSNILRAVYFAPVMLCPFVVTYLWQFMLSPLRGPVNMVLHAISGFPIDFPWLMQEQTSLFSVGIVQLWIALGYAMAIYIAGLQAIPQELIEAGKIDGVNYIQSFRYITFPLLAPAVTVNLMLSVIGCMKQFDIVFGLTHGGPGNSSETVTSVLVENIKAQCAGYGSAIGIILFIMIVFISMIQFKILRSQEVEL